MSGMPLERGDSSPPRLLLPEPRTDGWARQRGGEDEREEGRDGNTELGVRNMHCLEGLRPEAVHLRHRPWRVLGLPVRKKRGEPQGAAGV